MKISEQTLRILKNFASINPSILFNEGALMATRSIAGNIVAETEVEEYFPCKFALYDLVEFLNTLKLFKSPIIDFSMCERNFMVICEEDSPSFNVRYTFANQKYIKFPKQRPVMASKDVIFKFNKTTLDSVMKSANVMQLSNMTVMPGSDSSKVIIEVSDLKDKSSNKFSVEIEGESPEDSDFNLIFQMDTFKMIPNDYIVTISGNSTASFESDIVDYYIGLDPNSKF